MRWRWWIRASRCEHHSHHGHHEIGNFGHLVYTCRGSCIEVLRVGRYCTPTRYAIREKTEESDGSTVPQHKSVFIMPGSTIYTLYTKNVIEKINRNIRKVQLQLQ